MSKFHSFINVSKGLRPRSSPRRLMLDAPGRRPFAACLDKCGNRFQARGKAQEEKARGRYLSRRMEKMIRWGW